MHLMHLSSDKRNNNIQVAGNYNWPHSPPRLRFAIGHNHHNNNQLWPWHHNQNVCCSKLDQTRGVQTKWLPIHYWNTNIIIHTRKKACKHKHFKWTPRNSELKITYFTWIKQTKSKGKNETQKTIPAYTMEQKWLHYVIWLSLTHALFKGAQVSRQVSWRIKRI